MNLLEIAKQGELEPNSPRDAGLNDEETMNLAEAYVNNEIGSKGINAALKSLGYKINGGNGVTIIAQRLLRLAREGYIEIKRK